MTDFSTRPEIRGNFGAVTSTHWIASVAGMGRWNAVAMPLTPLSPSV